jgi:hypothetical protein
MLTYGLAILSKVGWLTWAFPVLFFAEYSAIVAWEERILERAFGERYRHYRESVGRWVPSVVPCGCGERSAGRPLAASRAERGSLASAALIYCLLIAKHLFFCEDVARLLGGGL